MTDFRSLLVRARQKFVEYEMDVEEPAPYEHRRLMDEIDAALAEGAAPRGADAEVAELVAALRADAECLAAEQPDLMEITNAQLSRAADLLEQTAAHLRPAPVATQELRDAFKNVLREARKYGFSSAEFYGNVADWLINVMREHSPCPTPAVDLAAVLAPGYSPGLGAQEGAQLVDGRWWLPASGCDSLQAVVDSFRTTAVVPVVEPGAADSIVDETGRPWHQTMDGALWAKAFVAIHGGDKELMIAWFCNAIMAGFDHAHWRAEKAMRPIPVAERLPTAADCLKGVAGAWFWVWCDCDQTWEQIDLYGMNWESRAEYGFTHWLPAAAIPLPEEEK